MSFTHGGVDHPSKGSKVRLPTLGIQQVTGEAVSADGGWLAMQA